MPRSGVGYSSRTPGSPDSSSSWDSADVSDDVRPFDMGHITSLQAMPNFGGGVSRMPPEARAMIDWAEEQLNKGRDN